MVKVLVTLGVNLKYLLYLMEICGHLRIFESPLYFGFWILDFGLTTLVTLPRGLTDGHFSPLLSSRCGGSFFLHILTVIFREQL